jgi:hypothetical protein
MNVIEAYTKWINSEDRMVGKLRNKGLDPWSVFNAQIQLNILNALTTEKKETTENGKERTSDRSKKGK